MIPLAGNLFRQRFPGIHLPISPDGRLRLLQDHLLPDFLQFMDQSVQSMLQSSGHDKPPLRSFSHVATSRMSPGIILRLLDTDMSASLGNLWNIGHNHWKCQRELIGRRFVHCPAATSSSSTSTGIQTSMAEHPPTRPLSVSSWRWVSTAEMRQSVAPGRHLCYRGATGKPHRRALPCTSSSAPLAADDRPPVKGYPMYAVIMAGGKGARFWPRSRNRMPKHLLDIVSEKTIIQETVARMAPLGGRPEKPCPPAWPAFSECRRRSFQSPLRCGHGGTGLCQDR